MRFGRADLAIEREAYQIVGTGVPMYRDVAQLD